MQRGDCGVASLVEGGAIGGVGGTCVAGDKGTAGDGDKDAHVGSADVIGADNVVKGKSDGCATNWTGEGEGCAGGDTDASGANTEFDEGDGRGDSRGDGRDDRVPKGSANVVGDGA